MIPDNPNPKPPNRVEPHRETLFEAHVRHDESTLRAELVSSLSGRPPALSFSRTLRNGTSYRINFGAICRADLLDAVKQWCAIVDAHESQGGPTSPRTSPAAIGVPGASSRSGGGR